jgi:hypothetical protein
VFMEEEAAEKKKEEEKQKKKEEKQKKKEEKQKKKEEKQKKKEGGQQGAGRTAEKFGAVRSADARPSSECGRGPIDGRLWACALAA